jgi:Zn-dependent protease
MSLDLVDKAFQFIMFLFALSVHESAHAYMAYRRGDPTAYMLGRVTLNPFKHMDPYGTVLLPLFALYYLGGIIGWAKPTPIVPRNFKHAKLDDILVTIAGPVSNLILATIFLLLLGAIAHSSPAAYDMVMTMPTEGLAGLDALREQTNSPLLPFVLLFYNGMVLNVILFVFNLLPIPPLDGSHIVRNFLPYSLLRYYDRIGMFGMFIIVFLLGGRLWSLINPVKDLFDSALLKF